jgi:hypothetical protein
MEISGQFHVPAALPPGKGTPVPIQVTCTPTDIITNFIYNLLILIIMYKGHLKLSIKLISQ